MDGIKSSELTGKVQTVLGLIDADAAGVALYHEHLISDMSAWSMEPENDEDRALSRQPVKMGNLYWMHTHRFNSPDNMRLDDEKVAITEAAQYRAAGGGTLVEVSSRGLGRDPRALVRIARATGLHIVMGCGYYIGASHPPEMARRAEEDIAAEIVKEITAGVGDTGIRAGIIGEIGCSLPLQDTERKVLKAAAMAQRQTGAGLVIHPPFEDDLVLEILDLLKDSGADLSHTAISHCNVRSYTPETKRRIADAGCFLGYESFGNLGYSHSSTGRMRETRSDLEYVEEIAQLVDEGYLDRILIALDICFKDFLTVYGGYGYAHIQRNLLPVMKYKGFTDAQLRTLMVENPKRLLTFSSVK